MPYPVDFPPRSCTGSPVSMVEYDGRSSTIDNSPQSTPNPTPVSRLFCDHAQNMMSQLSQPCAMNQQSWVNRDLSQNLPQQAAMVTVVKSSPEGTSTTLPKGKEQENPLLRTISTNAEYRRNICENQNITNMTSAQTNSSTSSSVMTQNSTLALRDYTYQVMLLEKQKTKRLAMSVGPEAAVEIPRIGSIVGGSMFDDTKNANPAMTDRNSDSPNHKWACQQMKEYPKMSQTLSQAQSVECQLVGNLEGPTVFDEVLPSGYGHNLAIAADMINLETQPPKSQNHHVIQVGRGPSQIPSQAPFSQAQSRKPLLTLSHYDLEHLLIEAESRKKSLEFRLQYISSQERRSQDASTELMLEPEQLLKRSQKLFRIAQAQLRDQLGMSMTDEEKNLVKFGDDFRALTKQHIRDRIFVESTRMDLLSQHPSWAERQISNNNKFTVNLAQASAVEKEQASKQTEQRENREEQAAKRAEQREIREKQQEDPAGLPHKSPHPFPKSPQQHGHVTPADRNGTDRCTVWVKKSHQPLYEPNLDVNERPVPTPSHIRGVRPSGTSSSPSGIRPLALPSSAATTQILTGIMVKTFTTADGQTSTTMSTNPDFELRNGLEIVTKTVKYRGKVTTTTTTAMIPLMDMNGKALHGLMQGSEKEMGNAAAGSDDSSDRDSDQASDLTSD